MRLLLIGIIRYVYKPVLSPILAALGARCRFYPSCSEYAIECLQDLPIIQAVVKIAWRLLRCQPLCDGGDDFPRIGRQHIHYI